MWVAVTPEGSRAIHVCISTGAHNTLQVINQAARPCWPCVAAAQTQASNWPTSSQAHCRSSICFPLSSFCLICILKKGLREEILKAHKFYLTVTFDLPRKSGTKMYFQNFVRVRVNTHYSFWKPTQFPAPTCLLVVVYSCSSSTEPVTFLWLPWALLYLNTGKTSYT